MNPQHKGTAIAISIFLSLVALTGATLQQVNTTSVQTLSNKTYASPIFTGTATGTYTLAGTLTLTSPTLNSATLNSPTLVTPILSNPTINGPTFSNTLAGTYTIGGTPTLGSSLAGGGFDITGLDELGFNNASADATAAGRVRRNGGALTWHDGSTAETLLTQQTAVKNPIINGNMEVWQRGTSFVSPATNTYTADRWKWRASGTSAVVNVNRSTNVPTVAQAGVLFNYSLEVDVTTADASVAAGDLVILEHDIEGYNWRHFAQRAITLSFWARDTVAGTHYVALANTSEDAVNNINIFSDYTIDAADTWEYKTISFVASPSAGTWDYVNGLGLRVKFILMAGSSFQGANEDQWNGGGSQTISNAGIVNSMSSTSNFFRLTGVKIELGSVATPVQFVPFDEEKLRCERYYEKGFDYATAPAQNVGSAFTRWNAIVAGAVTQYSPTVRYRVPKRGSVTLTFYNPNAANAQIRNLTDAADLSSTASYTNQEDGFIIQATGTAGTAVNEILGVNWAASSEF